MWASAVCSSQPRANGRRRRLEACRSSARCRLPPTWRSCSARTGYLCDDELATVTYLTLAMQRPLLLEGEPGTGKTALAEALAEALDLPLVRLQCYEGIDASQALYDWDFPRQILHLRALEAAGAPLALASRRPRRACTTSGSCWPARSSPRSSRARPCCWSTRSTGPTTSSRRSCSRCCRPGRSSIPELGTVTGRDAAGRRPHLQPHPRAARRAQAALPLPLDRAPRPRARGARSCARGRPRCPRRWRDRWSASSRSCATRDLTKPPGVAETLDWARALHHLGTAELDLGSARRDAGRPGEVPRGLRPGEAGAGPAAADMTTPWFPTGATGETRPARGTRARRTRSCSRSPGPSGPAGSRSPRTGPTSSSRPPPCSVPTSRPSVRIGRRGSTLCTGPDDLDRATTRSSRRSSTPAHGLPRVASGGPPDDQRRTSCRSTTATEGSSRRPTTSSAPRRAPPRCSAIATSPR